MEFLILLIGMVMIVEGIPYFAFPEKMKRILAEIQKMEPERLRIMGLISISIGLLICYLVRGMGLLR